MDTLYTFTGNATSLIAYAQLGANSKMYLCPAASIGADNAAALAASLLEVALSSKHACGYGAEEVELPPLQSMGGMVTMVGGVPAPTLGFTLSAVPTTTAHVVELNTFRAAYLNKTPLWLASFTDEKTVPGAIGMMGSWMVMMEEKKDQHNNVIEYDCKCRPAFVPTHKPQPYQVPAP